MEIRSALQKIENYLTVVSNLNKTILSEGTMSRDELLLMKKYLYTSIDRIEDIERSLVIDKSSAKSFTPTETIENKFIPKKEKEIVALQETDHVENVESSLSFELKEEMEDMVEDIQAEQNEIVAEIEIPKVEEQKIEETKIENEIPVIENVTAEDFVVNKNEVEETIIAETKIENEIPVIESVTTEDFVVNKNEVEETIIAETKIENEIPVIERVTTEDFVVNKNEVEETIIAETKIENETESLVEIMPLVANIISDENKMNSNEVQKNLVAETKTEEVSFFDKIKAEVANVTETISAKFDVKKPTTFAEELENNKKGETSFFEQLEQKQKETKESKLFEIFDDGKDDLHESFAKKNNDNNFETPKTFSENNTSFAHENENVLVIEQKQTVIEQLTPSSLNDVYKPQTLVENITTKSSTTLSESIALNDKFIFVRELFGNQFAEYENALKHMDTLANAVEAENYCNTVLWSKFNWTQRASEAGRFMDLMKKKMK